ncbi:hypothetical protein SAMN04244553_6356 [Nocardia amikacinitolerans]|uniref:Uncharacterized protein n=1 Tax=Nocardia amikacinitolerans TaxID=756689 RepID=A0A285LWL0_9NOCA|nr:hypothetical protein [Nocardia amikacinitolerans]MCP2279133.1 hypothetical protein [Nocardia amikacinitolerans]MCP2298111.1 hypothetical protein [Nocardia amikacinitolerans]SNY89344.1 hypothetical protein SAMN04244553_6356 [Nocardia amikacinitolerans]
MEHGQQGAESVGAILSGIAELLREVSDKLDSVAARVGDDNGVEARLKKLEAWAFRTEQNVSSLEARLDDVASGAAVERTVPSARAERRGHAARTDAPRSETLRSENLRAEAPRSEALRPETTRSETPRPETARSEALRPEAMRSETPRPEATRPETPRPETSRAERLRPTAPLRQETAPESPRTDSLEAAAVAARVEQQPAATNGLPRREPVSVPPALHDWVEPNVSRGAPYDAAPEPISNAHSEPAEIAPRTEAPQERLDYGSVGTPGVDAAPRLNGRLEAPTLTSRPDANLTAPRADREEPAAAPTQHRSAIEDNSHVDKLQAMLDELKRNPSGPFGRPLSTPPGDLPAQ